MGWNTWNKFACNIDEPLIKQSADQLIEYGLQDLGYTYINLDDCWQLADRDADGHVVADPTTFPNGMKVVGDYIHSKGLKFGIYSSAGTMTCQRRAGSLGYEAIDAADYADWGVDYLKYDNCYNNGVSAEVRYPAMRDALLATGRPIFYSICNWGEEETWKWAPTTGNSWRTTQDIFDGWSSIEYNFKKSQEHFEVSGPGGWNDPDMLEVGNGGMTIEEEKTHFALWALAKAPLIIGCDLTTVRPESLKILKNSNLIAVNQDPAAK
jgi:alpha-galactosidase